MTFPEPLRGAPRIILLTWCKSERNIQHLLRRALAGEPRDVLLRAQYPEGMPLPGILGDWDALTPEEQERLELAVASINQTYRERAPGRHAGAAGQRITWRRGRTRWTSCTSSPMSSWPLRCPRSLVTGPSATCLPGERSMQPGT